MRLHKFLWDFRYLYADEPHILLILIDQLQPSEVS